jgi:hypothetical protein
MPANRVSVDLSATEQREVMIAIATIRQKLSFLVPMSPEERGATVRLGDRNRAFIRKTLEIAAQNPEFLPRAFDLEEMRHDLELFEALQPMLLALAQLRELIDDTAVAAGSEAYSASLEIYHYAKANGMVTGLDDFKEATD